MSTPKKTHEPIRQNGQVVKKPQKHDANLQKNSILYFQVGLIVCLLAAYGLLEMRFETSIPNYSDRVPIEDPKDIYIDVVFKPEAPKIEKPIVQKRTKWTDKEPIIQKKDFPEDTPKIFTPPPVTGVPTSPEMPSTPDNPEYYTSEVDFIFVEEVPIYPGCEGEKTNSDKRKCMSDKITKLIQRKFEGNAIASEYGLTGKQKIDVQFTIDKTGHVKDIKTRAPHPKLKSEAERVINKIPEMTPGKQRDKPVGVIYHLPIIFIAE